MSSDLNHLSDIACEKAWLALASSKGDRLFTMDTNDKQRNTIRDYNAEWQDNAERKYAYGFDFDVMHRFMIEAFKPFWLSGSVLELGSFKGDFTSRLLSHFSTVDCVEASAEAARIAKSRFADLVNVYQERFEDVVLPKRYDNIVLTHVLEHVDDPVSLLSRIKTEWLKENGRLFLVCPNANAPSRQIAVRMGLISHNSAVTEAEREHGHRVTYSFDTLEREVRASGLKVIDRSGIFFKALANFQWDMAIAAGIVSEEYLRACYEFGQLYPELCSSIFLLCENQ